MVRPPGWRRPSKVAAYAAYISRSFRPGWPEHGRHQSEISFEGKRGKRLKMNLKRFRSRQAVSTVLQRAGGRTAPRRRQSSVAGFAEAARRLPHLAGGPTATPLGGAFTEQFLGTDAQGFGQLLELIRPQGYRVALPIGIGLTPSFFSFARFAASCEKIYIWISSFLH